MLAAHPATPVPHAPFSTLLPQTKTYSFFLGVLYYSICNCELGEADETDLALRATGRPPSRTPLSQSASALLDVKASNLAVKVHQNCAGPRLDLPSSTWQQLGHLGFMLHACRAWLHRQLSLLVSRLGRFSSTASRAMSQG